MNFDWLCTKILPVPSLKYATDWSVVFSCIGQHCFNILESVYTSSPREIITTNDTVVTCMMSEGHRKINIRLYSCFLRGKNKLLPSSLNVYFYSYLASSLSVMCEWQQHARDQVWRYALHVMVFAVSERVFFLCRHSLVLVLSRLFILKVSECHTMLEDNLTSKVLPCLWWRRCSNCLPLISSV